MKRTIILVLVLALVLMVLGVGLAFAGGHKPDPKVDVCHFTGHFSDVNPNVSDFIDDLPRFERRCNRLGGDVINVSYNAWENGHMQD